MTRSQIIEMLTAAEGYDLAVEWVQETDSGDAAAMAAYDAEDWPAFDAAADAFWAGWSKEDVRQEFAAYVGAVHG